MSRKKATTTTDQPMPDAVLDKMIHSPLSVPIEERESYWNGLLEDPEELRAATASVEFFPLISSFPPALWEKRLMMYVYRTAPKVKNQAHEKAYLEKIAQPIDLEYIKQNHGGGSYMIYLNLDTSNNLKQATFTIDGAPKFQPGQSLIDSSGNAIAPGTPAPGSSQSEVSQVINANAEANKKAIETVSAAADAAVTLQGKIFEKAAGIGGNGNDKLVEILLMKILDTKKEDATATALTLLDKIDGIIARRNPQQQDDRRDHTPITEISESVEVLTGTSLVDLLKQRNKSTGDEPGWVGGAISVVGRLIDNLPAVLERLSVIQEQNFRRALTIQSMQRGPAPLPAAPVETTPNRTPPPMVSVGVTPPPPERAPFIMQPAAAAPAPGPRPGPDFSTELENLAQGTMRAVELIAAKFRDGYSGAAVAQTLDVLYPGLLEQMAPVVLDPRQLATFVDGMPALAALKSDDDWTEFIDSFVDFVRDEMEETPSAPAPVRVVAPATA